MTIVPPKVRCLRCQYVWEPRIKERPKACPNCHSRRWYVPRRQ